MLLAQHFHVTDGASMFYSCLVGFQNDLLLITRSLGNTFDCCLCHSKKKRMLRFLCNVLYIPACLVSHIDSNHSPTATSTRQGKREFFSEFQLEVSFWVIIACIMHLYCTIVNQSNLFTCKTIFVTHRSKVVAVFMPFNIVRWRKVGRVRF